MSPRLSITIDLGRLYRRRAAPITAPTRSFARLVATSFRRERQVDDEVPDRTDDIVKCCEAISAQAFDFVLDQHHGTESEPWYRMHATAIRLDLDITNVGASTTDDRRRQLLDELAAAVIALRSAFEARIRATHDDDPSPTIIAASNDLVVLRCEDLVMMARHIGSQPS